MQIVRHGVFCRFHQNRSKVAAFHIAKPVGEPFDNSLLVPLIHLPYGNRLAAVVALVSVGNIKVIFKGISATLWVKDGDALAVFVHPTLKPPIPSFKLGNGDSIGALSID